MRRYRRFVLPVLICTGIGAVIGFSLSAYVMFYFKHPGAPMDLAQFSAWLLVNALANMPLGLFYVVKSRQYGIAWAVVVNWVGIGLVLGLMLGFLRARRPAPPED